MKSRRLQRGATIAEAAVTVVALFTLIMGAAEFGRAYNIYQNVTNAAREGARYAVVPDAATGALPGVADVQSRATLFLASSSITKATVTVGATSHVINNITVTYTQVIVVAPYTFFFFPFSPVNITATSEMRNETN